MVETILIECFQFFYKQVTREPAPKLTIIFKHYMGGGVFRYAGRLGLLFLCQRNRLLRMLETIDLSRLFPFKKVFEKIVAGKLSNFLESNSLLPFSQFSYRGDLETCDVLLTTYKCLGQGHGRKSCSVGLLSCI